MFVCLGVSSRSRFFHSFEDVTITAESLHTTRHSLPLNSEGFFNVPHILCNSHLLSSVWQHSYHFLGQRKPMTLTLVGQLLAVKQPI